MILTITPNPSVDYLFEAETLCWDDANRVEMPRKRAGGQGINLTRAARALGGESVALALFGGSAGTELKAMLAQEGTPFIDIPIDAETRVFFGVRETNTGRSMLVNARGPILSAHIRAELMQRVEDACRTLRPTWVVCSGSVPRGLGTDLYARICDIAHAQRARFVADCDGELLTQAVARGCELIVPNKHEAERLTAMKICSVSEAMSALHKLQATAPEVFLKLGAQGALAIDERALWLAQGPQLQSGSAVGAGDAFLAALLVAKENGASLQETLHCAVAAGTAALLSRGSDLLTAADYQNMLRQVQLTALSTS